MVQQKTLINHVVDVLVLATIAAFAFAVYLGVVLLILLILFLIFRKFYSDIDVLVFLIPIATASVVLFTFMAVGGMAWFLIFHGSP